MSTQPVPSMPNFNARVEEFRIWQPETYERNLRGATMASAEEGYLFLICAFDYVFNPGDLKTVGIQALYMVPEDQRPFGRDTAWFVNISADLTKKIAILLGNPTVTVSREGRNYVPPLFGRSQATGNTLYSAPLATIGGVRNGGSANYNLFTKAIETCCEGMIHDAMTDTIAQGIRNFRDRALTGEARATLVSRYNTLRSFYDDQALTKFGLVYR